MSNVTTTFRSAAGQVATTPVIYHVELTLADTEYSQALSSGTKRILINTPRTVAEYRYAWVAGGTGSVSDEYISVGQSVAIDIDGISFSGTLYLRASKAGTVVQVEEWS